jgi:hypothetical protein
MEAAQQLRRAHENAALDAAGHRGAKPLSSQVHGLGKGYVVWAYLGDQHDVRLRSLKGEGSLMGECTQGL